ncbi:hypothetical protein GEO21_16475 [Sphingobacterium faecium]|uniref:hypothetical protein n=1 Tax=Sphingobacterium faecium TaxID=34087 RepID=UPI000FAD1D0D|nr:hypothetical protein [Sphingobacterium faecium]MQP29094.1 hypothetical protein [Sphingobacterium faecium]
MSIVSKDFEIQENLIVLIEDLQNNIYDLRDRIADYSQLYNKTRNQIGECEVQHEKIADLIGEKHHSLYHKMKSLHYLFEIINDYRDCNGIFQDQNDMIVQVQEIMLAYAEKEFYEEAATIKKWYDLLYIAIYIK